jgi:hypothetical protein
VAAPDHDPDCRERRGHPREAQRQLDELLAELGEIASGEVVVGDPADELSYAANEFDCS